MRRRLFTRVDAVTDAVKVGVVQPSLQSDDPSLRRRRQDQFVDGKKAHPQERGLGVLPALIPNLQKNLLGCSANDWPETENASIGSNQ